MPDAIIQELTKGEYVIENKAACECSFVWSLSDDKKELVCEETFCNCHNTSILNVANLSILSSSHGDPVYVDVSGVEIKDIPSAVVQGMMKVSDDCSQLHFMKKRQALVDWLADCGYKIEAKRMRIGECYLYLLDIGHSFRNPVLDAGIFADGFLKRGFFLSTKGVSYVQ